MLEVYTEKRRKRFLSLLPRIYRAQPATSAVGALVQVMARALGRLDLDTRRVLHDRWVALASGASNGDDPAALERLATLIGAVPLGSGSAREEPEAFRRRLLRTARVLVDGLTTPPAILTLAIATLGAEPCPQINDELDATEGRGLRPGTTRRCSRCRDGGDGPCPFAGGEQELVRAWITENPPRWVERPEVAVRSGDSFWVENRSFVPTRPVINFHADPEKIAEQRQSLSFPALQDRASGDTVLYAGSLEPGERVEIYPEIRPADLKAFESRDLVGHYAWTPGAWKITPEGERTDVSQEIYIVSGVRFDDPTRALFGPLGHRQAARFGELRRAVYTPQLAVGDSRWRFLLYTRAELESVGGSLAEALAARAPTAVENHEDRAFVKLSWWARRGGSFRLSIPRTPWVREAEARGATELVRLIVERTRAIGVRSEVVFPEAEPGES